MDRRNFLRAATVPAAAAMATPAVAQEGAGETVTVAVGPGGALVYEPGTDAPLEVLPGTTVEFVWESDNHNIVVEAQPEAANWEGHEPLENTGFTYEHTFETLGTYEYYCEPHRSAGMVATIEVVEELSAAAAAAEKPLKELGVDIQAHWVGAATFLGIIVTMIFTFYILKYGESAHTGRGQR
jgi:plastocyanin